MSNESKIKIKTPTKKAKESKFKVYTLAGVAFAVIVAIGTLSVGNDKKPNLKPTGPEFIDLTPGEDKDWRNEMLVQYKSLIRQNKEILESAQNSEEKVQEVMEFSRKTNLENKSLKNQLENLEKQLLDLKNKAPSKNNRPLTNDDKISSLKNRIDKQISEQGRPNDGISGNYVLPPPPGMPYNFGKETSTETTETVTRITSKPQPKSQPLIYRARQDNYFDDSDAVPVEVTYVENEFAGMLPPGSFAKVSLLTGLDSGTSEYTRANPQPVLMRVQTDAQMSQGKYKLKSCFVLGSSYGDLSSERVFIQLSRISCVDNRSKMMLTGQLSGYVADADSVQGLKGKLIKRDGQLLAKSLLAGFASGLSSIAATAGTDQVQTVSGAINSTLDTDRILETGGAEGVNTTMEALAERYLEEAKNIFPVISVSGGRVGTIVLTKGVKLEWKSYSGKYQENVEPENTRTPKLF